MCACNLLHLEELLNVLNGHWRPKHFGALNFDLNANLTFLV